MRALLALAAVALAGCASNSGSPDAEYRAARALLWAEHYDQALLRADEALRRAERNGDPRVTWRFRLLKAEVLLGERQAPAASAVLTTDPPAGPEWAEYRGRAVLLKERAAFYLAHYAQAEDFIGRAAELARESGSASLAAEIDLARALLLVRQGRFEDAGSLLRGVIRASSELHETYLEATSMGNLGYTLLTASQYDEAIVWFEKAKDLHNRLGADGSLAQDNGNLGACFYRLGDYEKARSHYDQARAGFAKAGNHFNEQIWTGNAGNVLFATRDYRGAAGLYQRALAIAQQVGNDDWTSRWMNNLAETAIQRGDWNAAESYNNQALALKRRLGDVLYEASSLNNAARIAAGRGQVQDAEQIFRAVMSKPAEDPTVKLDSHAGLAELFVKTGRSRQAEQEFRAAVSTIEQLDSKIIKADYRFGYLASLIQFYREYVDFLIANHEPERALAVAESSRSRVLAERSGRSEAVSVQRPDAYQRLARGANRVLLEYWLGENASYLWVVTPGTIRWYPLPPASAIRPMVENYLAVIMAQRDPLAAAAETGRKLYDTLLAPAKEYLCQGCRVTIVPDEDLYALNFESLPAGGESGKYLVEQLTLAIAPSLDYLLEGARERPVQPGTGLLVMGDPVPALAEYPKLEFAAREIASITSAMQSSQEKVLRGADARPASYSEAQPGRYRLIHFSAHATANLESPLDSAVILSGPPERCKLFARDVMSVPLTAELVTISACRSAGAKTYAGEGLVGFAWAFLRAGARNVIAGTWDVNDRSTAQLMARLYEEIQRGAPPADALRNSKLALIRGGGAYAKPFYWAAFQVYTGVSQ
jgi:CHAT domain-containing protein/Tfp pilus assembly protein PilF